MSLKEISDILKDLLESQKQLTLRLKMIEIEIINLKENIPGRITNKNLDEDLKRKIVLKEALRIREKEERQELIYNSYSFHYETNMMDTSDYYFSE